MKRFLLLILVLLIWPLASAAAQDNTSVWVTTQDFSSLRSGPGMSFERIAVVDPGITLPAIGRSANTEWIQVDYQGQHGWINAGLLVWTGDVISLPVDGVDPMPFVRRAGVEGITTRETPIYTREVTPSDQIGTLPEGTVVEVTGRLGFDAQGLYSLQIFYQGQLYWVGAWDIRITGGNETNLLDTAYLYPYGRLGTQLQRDITNTTNTLHRIEDIWLRLQSGDSVSCGSIPTYATRRATDTDVAREPVFAPLVASLDAGINAVNAAISRFEDACSRDVLTGPDVTAALADIENARRNLNIAASLLVSLQVRDPLTGSR